MKKVISRKSAVLAVAVFTGAMMVLSGASRAEEGKADEAAKDCGAGVAKPACEAKADAATGACKAEVSAEKPCEKGKCGLTKDEKAECKAKKAECKAKKACCGSCTKAEAKPACAAESEAKAEVKPATE